MLLTNTMFLDPAGVTNGSKNGRAEVCATRGWDERARALQQLKLGEDAQLQSSKALLGAQNAKNMRIWNQFRIFTEISQHDLISDVNVRQLVSGSRTMTFQGA